MWYEFIQGIGRVFTGALWIVPVFMLLALVAFVGLGIALFLAGTVLRLRDVIRGRLHGRRGSQTGGYRKMHPLGT
ncbi:MAG: hypothetical protein V1724_04600 [Chloroflexota bacterium]